MTYTRVSERFLHLFAQAMKSTRLLVLALLAAFTSVAMQPAQAQSSDTWKSVAIIGGSTAVGAYVGHKVGGSTGAFIGAGMGATAGYEIDQRRRAGQYYNQASYNDGGYYGNNGGSYGNNGPYNGNGNGGYYGNGNGGYSGDPNGGYPYPSGYQSNYYTNRSSNRR